MTAAIIFTACLALPTAVLAWALHNNEITSDGATRMTRKQRRKLGRMKADLRAALRRES